MPEIKVKQIVSFSSEDKVFTAGNLLKAETYRKWKCATGGEKKCSAILQFEEATQIQSIHIGNEYSAFVEVLVSRSSEADKDFKVLLVASSFMSPLESRNGTNINRVRIFEQDKLVVNTRSEKWDQVQIVCTQPFNKTVQYGLSFVKFHSPPLANSSPTPGTDQVKTKFGSFKLKTEEEDGVSVGKWFLKRKNVEDNLSSTSPSAIRQASSFAAATLASGESVLKFPPTVQSTKRKLDEETESPLLAKRKEIFQVNREKISYKINMKDMKAAESPSSSKSSHVSKPVVKTQEQSEKRKPAVKKPFSQLFEKVVLVISGIQNPLRSDIREYALEMGAKYKGDWDSTCTHLVSAFVNTPKYLQVKGKKGRIVTKDWVIDCYKKREFLPWRKYMLGQYKIETSSEEEEETTQNDAPEVKRVKVENKTPQKVAVKQNGFVKKTLSSQSKDPVPSTSKTLSPSLKNPVPSTSKTLSPWSKDPVPSRSKTLSPSSKNSLPSTSKAEVQPIASDEDSTDAEMDYRADTDVDESTGGDTDDEICKIENEFRANSNYSLGKVNSPKTKEAAKRLFPSKPDTSHLTLPELQDFFKGKHFFLYGRFTDKERHDLERYITAYNGVIENYMADNVKYVLTYSKWSNDFDEALTENDNLIFVHPKWVYRCYQSGKLVPYQPHIVVPED